MKQSPLESLHLSLGAKMVPFAGWTMPVQYSSIMKEHNAVREGCGVFDISHMGQFFLEGEGAEEWLNSILSNDITKLGIGEAQYTLMLNDTGGVIDDLILYLLAKDQIFMVVNASKIEEDYQWLSERLPKNLSLANDSASWAGMAIQGPEAAKIYEKVFSNRVLPSKNGIDRWEENGETNIVCTTGYTGEHGFEFFCSATQGVAWFQRFMELGAEPCGLGARDSLRLEVCYPLNGSDLSRENTPIEAGLGFFCKLDKDFIGCDVLRKQKKDGLHVKLVAIEYTGKGAPPRSGYEVYNKGGKFLTRLTSGVMSPSLKRGIAMAYLPIDLTKLGTEVEIDVRGRRYPAIVVKKPFYKHG